MITQIVFKDGHYIMASGVIQQGDMTALNMYILNTTSKYVKQKLMELKIGIGKFTIIAGDFDKKEWIGGKKVSTEDLASPN